MPFATYNLHEALTAAMVFDDTVPQISEGTEIIRLIVPAMASASNKLRVRVRGAASASVVTAVGVAAFIDAGLDALAASYTTIPAASYTVVPFSIEKEISPGDTNEHVISVRVGPVSGSLYLNGSTITRVFGGTMEATLVVDEIAADEEDNVLVTGQSNALGVGVGAPAFSTANPLVRVRNNSNSTAALGTGLVHPVEGAAPFNGSANNLGVWFCDAKADASGKQVNMILSGSAGTAMSQWAGAGTAQFDRIVAAWKASGLKPAKTLLLQEGEADLTLGTTYAAFRTSFLTMVTGLQSVGVLASGVKIVLGGTPELDAAHVTFNTNVLAALATAQGYGYASSTGLAFDGTGHFTAAALSTLGQRHFAALP